MLLPLCAALVVANPIVAYQNGVNGANAVDGAEYQAAGSWVNGTGNVVLSTSHVLQSTFTLNYFPPAPGSTGQGNPEVSGGTTGTHNLLTTTTGSTTTGSTGIIQAQVLGNDYYLEITNPTQSGAVPLQVSNVVVNSSGATQPGLRIYKVREVTNSGNVTFPSGYQNGASQGSLLANLASTGVLSGGGMTTVETGVGWSETWQSTDAGQTWSLHGRVVNSTVTQVLQNFNVAKCAALNASIDTRVTYGVPNDAGVLPGADPNASLGPLNYTPWWYSGGLFVGNAPWIDNDGSGRSRTQFWPQGVTSALTPNCYSTFVAFYLGTTTAYSGNMTVGLFTPASSDNPAGTSEATANWPNRWASLDPGGAGTFITSYAFTPTSNLNDYYNFHMGVNQPLNALQYLALVNTQEQSFQQNNTQAWRYFASRWYTASLLNPAFPYTDCAPRLWVVTPNGSPTNWTTPNSVFGAS